MLLKKYPNYTLGYIDKGYLEEHQIPCSIEFDRIGNIPEITGDFMGGVALMVEEKYYHQAKKTLQKKEYEKNPQKKNHDNTLKEEDKKKIQQTIQELKEKEQYIQNKQPQKKTNQNPKENIFQYFHIPIEFILYIVVFTFLGKLADDTWYSSPWGILIGLFIGFSLALYKITKIKL